MSNQKSGAKKKTKPTSKPQTCEKCLKVFPSKNSLFRHLRINSDKCLTEEEHEDYLASTLKYEKVAILYGYIPRKCNRGHRVGKEDTVTGAKLSGQNDTDQKNENESTIITGGEDAALVLMKALQMMHNLKYKRSNQIEYYKQQNSMSTINRSYGCVSRSNPIIAQDNFTGAISEVIACRVPPLIYEDDDESNGNKRNGKKEELESEKAKISKKIAIKNWTDQVSEIIQTYFLPDPTINGSIKVFGRLNVPAKFNAEFDVSHRRMEYMLPADFLYSNLGESYCHHLGSRQTILNGLPSFQPGSHSKKNSIETLMKQGNKEKLHEGISTNQRVDVGRPEKEFLEFLYKVKKIMQKLTTQIEVLDENDEGAVLEKQFHDLKRKKKKQKSHEKQNDKKQREGASAVSKKGKDTAEETGEGHSSHKNKALIGDKSSATNHNNKKSKSQQQHVLRRKRYHNFTPTVMAHDFLAFRRMDRFYHRSTLRFDNANLEINYEEKCCRPFIVLSFTGDQFLLGQIRGVIGLFLAVIRGHIDETFIDCIFDEEYTSLVPAPFAPSRGLYAGAALYTSWEGKASMILSPRECNRYSEGWNDDEVLRDVNEWTHNLQQSLAKSWYEEGVIQEGYGEGTRLAADKIWEEEVLVPWAKTAQIQLEDYKKWKASIAGKSSAPSTHNDLSSLPGDCEKQNAVVESIDDSHVLDLVPSLASVDPNVPKLYEKVLFYLREANESGLWPKTTLKRQLVMSSTANEDSNRGYKERQSEHRPAQSSLSMAFMKAKKNKEERASAYSFAEGQGGASGSFSVGGMPGKQCEQPKGNTLFPELMKAAFELEIALCPNREPSSTIAINRNAQFRPHTDNGAGAGQSTSLIVGLGIYSGGELMVEGAKNDIRYRPIEFNGWTQRHWTLPFRGERYSLVWFTPKGCEGIRGIDLCN